jgi:hypothetical protein
MDQRRGQGEDMQRRGRVDSWTRGGDKERRGRERRGREK